MKAMILLRVGYDRAADILYIRVRDSKIVDTRSLGEDLYIGDSF